MLPISNMLLYLFRCDTMSRYGENIVKVSCCLSPDMIHQLNDRFVNFRIQDVHIRQIHLSKYTAMYTDPHTHTHRQGWKWDQAGTSMVDSKIHHHFFPEINHTGMSGTPNPRTQVISIQ